MDKTYYIKTIGCQMNVHDSDRITRSLKLKGFVSVLDPKKADIILLNTCSIRAKAEQKAFSEIGRYKLIKKNKSKTIIGVIGCTAQKMGFSLFDRFPFIDIVCGTHELFDLDKKIESLVSNQTKIFGNKLSTDYHFFNSLPQKDEKVANLVTIMHGCNNYCAYCVVPYTRGPEVSRKASEIINEIKSLVDKGAKEVTLLGQNVNSYNGDIDFPSLLSKINTIDGLLRIRFVTSHPKDLSDKLIDCFGTLPKLCEHIHLPVQSGSDKILEAMNRKYTAQHYLGLIEKLKNKCPNIAITTDLIVGFPGETENDFEATVSLVEKVKFDNFFSFKYSRRDGTSAYNLADTVSEKEKTARLHTLHKIQEKITKDYDKNYEGKILGILIEGVSEKDKSMLTGRSRSNRIVHCKGDKSLIGKLLNVRIVKAHEHFLLGEVND